MSTGQQDDLDLLLSLQDRVLETPPSSPSSSHPRPSGYQSDDEVRRPSGNVDLSAFKTVVEDCMDYDVEAAKKALKSNRSNNPTEPDVEKFSGLRIRNQVVSSAELSNQFSDIRFVRLSAIKNLIKGDTLSGSWVTVGVLTEKGSPKTSTTGKGYCIWKIGCLDGQLVTVFLFGDAYKLHNKETASTVFAFFNANVRKDSTGSGFQLSIFKANQIMRIGTSVDYGVCKGRKKDGLPCSIVVNKRLGIYCSFHRAKTSEKYRVSRAELKGGNLKTAFRNLRQPEGIYMVDRLAERTNISKKPQKVLSVDGLKKALSNAGHVTTNSHSQGIRFLNEITVSMSAKTAKNEYAQKNQLKSGSLKRSLSTANSGSSNMQKSSLPDSKRVRPEPRQVSPQNPKETTNKMIELEYVSSDDDCFKL